MKKASGGRQKVYHEIPDEFEEGDFPPCGSQTKNMNPHDYEKVTLKKAINRWAEPCNHVECTEIRTEGLSRDDYKKEDFLRQKFWREKMTQNQIAEEVGVDRDTVRRWMNRNNIPTTKEEYERVYGEKPPDKRYREVTEEERKQVLEENDWVFLCDTEWTDEPRIHIPETDSDPICYQASPEVLEEIESANVKYEALCKQCMANWRC